MRVPCVVRMAPELTILTETVGWNARQNFGRTILLQPEKLRICANIGAVGRHEDGDVADERNAALRAVRAQLSPLRIELELNERVHGPRARVRSGDEVDPRGEPCRAFEKALVFRRFRPVFRSERFGCFRRTRHAERTTRAEIAIAAKKSRRFARGQLQV